MNERRVQTSRGAALSTLVLRALDCAQIQRIDAMLDELGPFGELRLIKKNGRLRFIEKVESFDIRDETT